MFLTVISLSSFPLSTLLLSMLHWPSTSRKLVRTSTLSGPKWMLILNPPIWRQWSCKPAEDPERLCACSPGGARFPKDLPDLQLAVQQAWLDFPLLDETPETSLHILEKKGEAMLEQLWLVSEVACGLHSPPNTHPRTFHNSWCRSPSQDFAKLPPRFWSGGFFIKEPSWASQATIQVVEGPGQVTFGQGDDQDAGHGAVDTGRQENTKAIQSVAELHWSSSGIHGQCGSVLRRHVRNTYEFPGQRGSWCPQDCSSIIWATGLGRIQEQKNKPIWETKCHLKEEPRPAPSVTQQRHGDTWKQKWCGILTLVYCICCCHL